MYLNRVLVKQSLEEFSSRDAQLYLWTKAGDGKRISSFVEACCGLFDDSGLGVILRTGAQFVISQELRDLLIKLDQALDSVDDEQDPEIVIDLPEMEVVRRLAKAALNNIAVSES